MARIHTHSHNKINKCHLIVKRSTAPVMTYLSLLFLLAGYRGITMVKVLCYKSEGRWFDPS